MRAASLCVVLVGQTPVLAQPADHPQCRNPLFETHWAGKNDIETLNDFPNVKTNLKKCPAFNDRASCCHQRFENEQLKYFAFWRRSFEQLVLRLNEHRLSVIDALPASGLSRQDQEQYEAVLDRYRDVLSPHRQGRCFSALLKYTAGMMCYSCRPEWFHFTLLSGTVLAGEKVQRVRIARSVCLQLWDHCASFGDLAMALSAAIRDSVVARRARRAFENLDIFAGQQQLCDWMHDQVALHPFRLPTQEDRQIGSRRLSWNSSALSDVASRRLDATPGGPELDVLADGAKSRFDMEWRAPEGLSPEVWLAGAQTVRPLGCNVQFFAVLTMVLCRPCM